MGGLATRHDGYQVLFALYKDLAFHIYHKVMSSVYARNVIILGRSLSIALMLQD